LEENTNRDVNLRGEDLTGESSPRKRQNDRRSGGFVKNYGNKLTGDFAAPEWETSTPATETEGAEGWGDAPASTTTEDHAAAWDSVNQATTQTAPTQATYAENKPKSEKKPLAEKPKQPPPQKSFDDFLAEKQKKKQEVADLLASKGLPVSPRTAPTEEAAKTSKSVKPAAKQPTQNTQVLESLFKFESTRPRFNDNAADSLPDDPPPGYENTTPRRGRGGRRGGRGGRNQGGRGNFQNNNYDNQYQENTAAAVASANTPQYYDPSSVSREDEWPTLV
jgi:hypothetical protein